MNTCNAKLWETSSCKRRINPFLERICRTDLTSRNPSQPQSHISIPYNGSINPSIQITSSSSAVKHLHPRPPRQTQYNSTGRILTSLVSTPPAPTAPIAINSPPVCAGKTESIPTPPNNDPSTHPVSNTNSISILLEWCSLKLDYCNALNMRSIRGVARGRIFLLWRCRGSLLRWRGI